MKNLIQAAVVTLFAASTAQAQQAVQWKVSDGGNGHWYHWLQRVPGRDWDGWRAYAAGIGGHLATLTTPEENSFVTGPIVLQGAQASSNGGTAFFGAFQRSGSAEPSGGWQWVTGEPFVLDADRWHSLEDCCNGSYCNGEGEDAASLWSWAGDIQDKFVERKWNDVGKCLDWWGAVIEWSADCNSDGIVDYGQCRDGTLPDYNGNNIPDCCERAEACVVGNYPVQWRTEDGGNGHWYQAIRALPIPTTFSEQDAFATSRGAVMATMSTSQENDFVVSIMGTAASEHNGAMFGLRRQADGGWAWCDQTPLGFAAWGGSSCSSGPYPNNSTLPGEMCGHLYLQNCGWIWDDTPPSWSPGYTNLRLLIEWSADCNQDGIVDYGQILTGQLADLNADGVPDVCQQPTCVDADLFRDFNVNGADLGILLSQWGAANPLTVSDINSDGVVNGADLGLLLSFWGACS
jgi:hypothetical protein